MDMEYEVLNLYGGLGGNRKLWKNVRVTAVEKNREIANVYQQNFPYDEVIVGDAHEYLRTHPNLEQFRFIWSSPPCQDNSRMAIATRHKNRKFPDMTVFEEIIFLDTHFKGRWVVENVKPYYNRIVMHPTCDIGRHRFWSNFRVESIKPPRFKDFINTTTVEGAERLKNWLGLFYEGQIYYEGNHCPGQVLRNCVHPEVGLHVFEEGKKYAVQGAIL